MYAVNGVCMQGMFVALSTMLCMILYWERMMNDAFGSARCWKGTVFGYQGLDSLLPELLPVRVKVLPNFSKMDPEMVYRLFTNNKNATKVSSDFLMARMARLSASSPMSFFTFTKAVADQLNLPRILLGTTSATFSSTMASVKLLQQNEVISITDGLPNMHIPKIQPLRIKDIPDFSMTDPDTCERFWADMINAIRSALGCIMNTFDDLEPTAFEKVRQDCHPMPLFAVGPLCKFSPGSSNSLLTQDYSCMAWLDKQAPQSVIYISFGSLASITKTDLVEIAWGLANSDQPFLWVVRPGSIHGHDCNELLEGFEEKTRERDQIVKWAPQQEVLAHPSVGGFWTHNGWNSTLESICEGVPMLCSPYLWDQNVHARYVSHVWRVGMQLEKGFDGSEIEWAVRRLMVEIEGKEMRERVGALKENAMRCMAKGGSSYESLESLIDLIMSL
ncbi:UDP-glycosyltransferase 76B1-like [Magnolia sinica]|uniref:UDP-glycosyltransferase 76B1-like n=1 Tax=Magnolia sinica TaxID=86752 RepID=UPI002658C553|nr:UDP-glycosyltransferase 76B1-like [Magnolia sinica]